jgi:hypothetical protein
LFAEGWFPDLKAHSKIIRTGFLGKGNKVYYPSDEEEDWENQPLKALSSHF